MSALAGATRIIERPATATQAQSGADGFTATDPCTDHGDPDPDEIDVLHNHSSCLKRSLRSHSNCCSSSPERLRFVEEEQENG